MDDTAFTGTLPTLAIEPPWNWDKVLAGPARELLTKAMAEAIATRRWFGSKARTVRSLEILDALALDQRIRALIVQVHFASGPEEVYQIPLTFLPAGGEAPTSGDMLWIQVRSSSGELLGGFVDALGDQQFLKLLLELFDQPGVRAGTNGKVLIQRSAAFSEARGDAKQILAPRLVQAEQSNSSVIYGDRLIMKIFRRIEMGLNPDVEISNFLTRQHFANTPPLAGSVDYRQDGEPWALAMLQAYVPNLGDAWKFTLDWLSASLPSFGAGGLGNDIPASPDTNLLTAAQEVVAEPAKSAFGNYLTRLDLLGRRTAEMHLKLASDSQDANFAPEPFTEIDRQQFCRRASEQAGKTFALLRERAGNMPSDLKQQAERVASLEPLSLAHFARLATEAVEVDKMRIHGDYHLGQILTTTDDFAIIDFEGEPIRSISERRQKQPALRDVAGMIRSLHYASCAAASEARPAASRAECAEAWMRAWYEWSSVAFLAAYRRKAGAARFLPASDDAFLLLLESCLLDKAIYELRYELNNRPDWVYLPIAALVDLLRKPE